MTNDETIEGDVRNLRGMMNALFSILLPMAIIIALISSFHFGYTHLGSGGILGTAAVWICIALIGELYTREVDNVKE